MVRAKFSCGDVKVNDGEEFKDGFPVIDGDGKPVRTKYSEVVTLHAVTSSGPDDPNKTWAKYTPSGQMRMQIDNPDCWGRFVAGQAYYLDFTPVEAK